MKARSRSTRIAAQLADLKMPGALEALDEVLAGVDGGGTTAGEAIERLLAAQITLRSALSITVTRRDCHREYFGGEEYEAVAFNKDRNYPGTAAHVAVMG